jgi:hypothetical protein
LKEKNQVISTYFLSLGRDSEELVPVRIEVAFFVLFHITLSNILYLLASMILPSNFFNPY